jgi:hypothetical protein
LLFRDVEVLDCLYTGNDYEEIAPEDIHYTSCAIRRYEVGRVRWDRAVSFEGGICIYKTWKEEDNEAVRHCGETRQQIVVIYSDTLSIYND